MRKSLKIVFWLFVLVVAGLLWINRPDSVPVFDFDKIEFSDLDVDNKKAVLLALRISDKEPYMKHRWRINSALELGMLEYLNASPNQMEYKRNLDALYNGQRDFVGRAV